MQTQLAKETPASRKPGGSGRAALVMVGMALLFAALFAAGYLPRVRNRAELAGVARAAGSELPVVNVVAAHRAASSESFRLPGSVDAIQAASIFARSNGYLKRRLVDIGDRVRAGQLLAEIETPEVAQELRQAEASLAQARAALGQKRAALAQARTNLDLAGVTNRRWKDLVDQGVFSKQAGDEKQSAYDARRADVEAAQADIRAAEANIGLQEANIQRLKELLSFQKVTAPFDGVITARNMDAGDLVTSGSASSVKDIFKVAQIGNLRVFINVPQAQVPAIQTGQSARVTVQELPGRTFAGRVTRTANALDPGSRTLLTEVQVANPDRVLLPGMYAEVEFAAANARPGLLVPATVLVVRPDGSSAIAVVDASDKIRYARVRIGRDYGAEAEVVAGLEGSERLVINPADDLAEGTTVRVVASRK